ncbi:MAG: D-aminoacyl-tRNA deacylase [Candidatus Margulisiibacteriota bacterium]
MKAIIQRVKSARVEVNHHEIANINGGILVLLGIQSGDSFSDAESMVKKIVELRIFSNQEGKFDHSLLDIKGDALVVSQFTLLANCQKGRRPSFSQAAPPKEASNIFNKTVALLKAYPIGKIQTGQFGADMQVELINDGPVTIPLDSRKFSSFQ